LVDRHIAWATSSNAIKLEKSRTDKTIARSQKGGDILTHGHEPWGF
jgi:hypothetical protein